MPAGIKPLPVQMWPRSLTYHYMFRGQWVKCNFSANVFIWLFLASWCFGFSKWITSTSYLLLLWVSFSHTGISHGSNEQFHWYFSMTIWINWKLHVVLIHIVIWLIKKCAHNMAHPIINHCLGLGHETMVCAVCLTMFLWQLCCDVMCINLQWFNAQKCEYN